MLTVLVVYSDHIKAEQHKLLILGDSLSAAYGLKAEQGWVHLLQSRWSSSQITVINAAVSGETTDGGLARLPRLLEQHAPTHLYIELGGNDGLQGHPVAKMRNNISQMIHIAKEKDIAVILQQMQIPTNFGRRYTSMFTAAFSELGEQHSIPVIPFFLESIALDSNYMQRDGIHPNAAAQPIIADTLRMQLEPLIVSSEPQ